MRRLFNTLEANDPILYYPIPCLSSSAVLPFVLTDSTSPATMSQPYGQPAMVTTNTIQPIGFVTVQPGAQKMEPKDFEYPLFGCFGDCRACIKTTCVPCVTAGQTKAQMENGTDCCFDCCCYYSKFCFPENYNL